MANGLKKEYDAIDGDSGSGYGKQRRHRASERAMRQSVASGCPLCLILLESRERGQQEKRTWREQSPVSPQSVPDSESESRSIFEDPPRCGSGSTGDLVGASLGKITSGLGDSPCSEKITRGRRHHRKFALLMATLPRHRKSIQGPRTCVGFTYECDRSLIYQDEPVLIWPNAKSIFKFRRTSSTLGEGYIGNRLTQELDFNLWRSWIDDCQQLHADCTPDQATELTTQVIDLEGTPRLVESNGRSTQYVTLSHCWGTSVPLRTLAANYAAHLVEVTWSKFSTTFRDAAKVTLARGCRYL